MVIALWLLLLLVVLFSAHYYPYSSVNRNELLQWRIVTYNILLLQWTHEVQLLHFCIPFSPHVDITHHAEPVSTSVEGMYQWITLPYHHTWGITLSPYLITIPEVLLLPSHRTFSPYPRYDNVLYYLITNYLLTKPPV